jgi:hypothetical protein
MTLLRLPPILLLSVSFASLSAANPMAHMGATITDAILQAGMRYHASAGIHPADDREAGRIVAEAAMLLGISAVQLDASI